MRVPRLYLDETIAEGMDVALTEDQPHYLTNVLRLDVGNTVHLFNARCGEFVGKISAARKGEVTVTVEQRLAEFITPALSIELCLAMSRGDRMDYAIQKSVELGAASITPFQSEFGEVRFKQAERASRKLQHWQRIAISASEQCGRLDIPEIAAPKDFSQCVEAGAEITQLLFDPSGTHSLEDIKITSQVRVITGPEGGFSPAELTLAAEADCKVVKLGPRIFRTETAPVAILAVLQNRFGDL